MACVREELAPLVLGTCNGSLCWPKIVMAGCSRNELCSAASIWPRNCVERLVSCMSRWKVRRRARSRVGPRNAVRARRLGCRPTLSARR